jgi:microcystin-dependent protein
MSEPFIAEVRIFAGNFAPRGWAFCDRQLLPIAQNTALFSLIGTTYGGDGRTTTALADMQGRVPMHPGRVPGLTSPRLGQKTGVEEVTLTLNEIPAHSHSWFGTTEDGDSSEPAGNLYAKAGEDIYAESGNVISMSDNATSNTGGGEAHNNVQPFISLNFIIALVGLYPSRS